MNTTWHLNCTLLQLRLVNSHSSEPAAHIRDQPWPDPHGFVHDHVEQRVSFHRRSGGLDKRSSSLKKIDYLNVGEVASLATAEF